MFYLLNPLVIPGIMLSGDMIHDITILYNRTRQAAITTELVEIISGAEAL